MLAGIATAPEYAATAAVDVIEVATTTVAAPPVVAVVTAARTVEPLPPAQVRFRVYANETLTVCRMLQVFLYPLFLNSNTFNLMVANASAG